MSSPEEFTDESRSARRRRVRYRLGAAILLVLASFVVALATRAEDAAFSGGDRGPEDASGSAPTLQSREQIPNVPDGSQASLKDTRGTPEEVSEKPLDVLVLGVDKRPPGSEETQVTGARSDTMMVVRVEPDTGEIKLLSIPRDLLVELGSGQDKINASYAYGGAEGAKAAVEDLTGIRVDNHAVVDFEGFEEVIDAIGGVKVDVEDELPPKYGIGDGPQTLDGRQALFYARYRGTAGGDLDRVKRQQRLVAALRDQAVGWNTVTKLPGVVKATNKNVETNLGLWEAISLGRTLASRGRDTKVTSVQLEGIPETLPNGSQVLVQDEAANEAVLEKFHDR